LHGKGVDKDPEELDKYYGIICKNKGYEDYCYSQAGVREDYSFKNLKEYEKLCEDGNESRCILSGDFYYIGKVYKSEKWISIRDKIRAFKYYKKACDLGHKNACRIYHKSYCRGESL